MWVIRCRTEGLGQFPLRIEEELNDCGRCSHTRPTRKGGASWRPGQGRLRLARHLRRPGTRGLYVSATGTGKTLVSIRMADELDARLVLFVVPTLDLAAQTAMASTC
ncbi:DEAD/DEAH box helicase family protein [Streptomyces sp. NPDC058145]|uniref:DEAD/DEAH box helicase family protein n=1 Tax=Streptomyces sp. NPDC058145 TaxID=3346356 RepID=UPI0036F0DCEF